MRGGFGLELLQLFLKLAARGGLVFEFLQLLDQIFYLVIERIQFQTGLRHNQRVVQPVELEQEVDITKDCFGAVRAKSERLLEGKIGFPHQRLQIGIVFRGKFGRAIPAQPPRIHAGDGTAEFGKRLLGVVVADEFAVALGNRRNCCRDKPSGRSRRFP